MQTQIIWKGIYYQSLEHCVVSHTETGNEIVAVIIGMHESQLFKVDYHICTNAHWEALFLQISAQVNGVATTHTLHDKAYIDISLTPFTNTLPVNGLELGVGERRVIDVIYIDVLENEIKRTQQVYTRLSDNEYLFETIDGSFSATIQVDEQGLVTHYPELFEMAAKKDLSI